MPTPFPNWMPNGIIPAVLLPFTAELEIDEASFRDHLRDVLSVDGITAITLNCHSTEVHACTLDEQKRILDIGIEEAAGRLPVISGVYADGSVEAALLARMAAEGGASALLVFPPHTLAIGGYLRPEMAIEHFRRIADASDLPIIVFNYPMASNVGYPFETLLKLFEAVPSIRAIKDWCNDPPLHERQIRTFQNLPRPVNVLSTHSAWLMSSLVMGCAGALSGAGSVIAALQVDLFEAIRDRDMARAMAVNDRIYPLAQVFYAPPFLDMHNRMKELLVILGKLSCAAVRPPLSKLPPHEIKRIEKAADEAGLRSG
jgi:4-hydroxy-tetrahydrodipicolinate synthase